MTDNATAHAYDVEGSHFDPATGKNVDRCKCGFTIRWHVSDPEPMEILRAHMCSVTQDNN